jgi:hypothetical protein
MLRPATSIFKRLSDAGFRQIHLLERMLDSISCGGPPFRKTLEHGSLIAENVKFKCSVFSKGRCGPRGKERKTMARNAPRRAEKECLSLTKRELAVMSFSSDGRRDGCGCRWLRPRSWPGRSHAVLPWGRPRHRGRCTPRFGVRRSRRGASCHQQD